MSDEAVSGAEPASVDVGSERPRAEIFRLKDQTQIRWHENNIGGTDHPWWFYNVMEVSRWFSAMCISCLQPGECNGFHSHMEETEGPYESWYLVLKGEAQLRTEHGDAQLNAFDAAFMPPGASHQFRNVSTEPVWWMTISSRGGQPLKVDTYSLECSEARPGYMEEYNRIIAARKARGLAA
jgi:mannose-6-phosphate isomerase-like protein (cupin superfamily)